MHLCIWHRAPGTLSRVFTCWAPRSWYCFHQYSAILKTLHYNALHSIIQILLQSTTMHVYKCFPLRGQVSPIQAVSMGGSPARGLAILLDIHSQEIHSQEIHFQEIIFREPITRKLIGEECFGWGSPARGLAIRLDIHFRETHFLENDSLKDWQVKVCGIHDTLSISNLM